MNWWSANLSGLSNRDVAHLDFNAVHQMCVFCAGKKNIYLKTTLSPAKRMLLLIFVFFIDF